MFVTLIMAAMLAVILAGAYKIEIRAFYVLLAALAGYGFVRGAGDLCRWLQADKPQIETVEAEEVDPFAHDDEFGECKARMSFGTIKYRDGKYTEAK
jgi:hypothetical protein